MGPVNTTTGLPTYVEPTDRGIWVMCSWRTFICITLLRGGEWCRWLWLSTRVGVSASFPPAAGLSHHPLLLWEFTLLFILLAQSPTIVLVYNDLSCVSKDPGTTTCWTTGKSWHLRYLRSLNCMGCREVDVTLNTGFWKSGSRVYINSNVKMSGEKLWDQNNSNFKYYLVFCFFFQLANVEHMA